MYFAGDTGIGKSRTAALIASLACNEKISVKWFEMPEYLARLRGTMNPRAEETEGHVLDEMLSPDLVILDDLGAERCSEWVMEKLYMVLNGRYKRKEKVIITSNLPLAELKAYWSADPRCAPTAERLVSRIAGMCKVVDRFGKQDLRNK
jgi:DNA replication protein DnaC